MKKIIGSIFASAAIASLSCPAAFAQGTSRLVTITTSVVTSGGQPISCTTPEKKTGVVMQVKIKGREEGTDFLTSTNYLFCQPEVIPQVDYQKVRGIFDYLQETGNTVPLIVVPDDRP